MKGIILIVALLFSSNIFSVVAKVFCKNGSEVKDILSKNGQECRGEFLSVEGDVCFTGSRTDEIKFHIQSLMI